MKFLVTGASGMLGSELLRVLADRGQEAEGLDRARFVAARRSERAALLNDFDVVIHAAANTNVEQCETDPEATFRDNCHLTEQLFASACRQGAKFVFMSSTGVYGRGKAEPFHEYDVPVPTTVHHKSKRMAEQVVLASPVSLVVRTGWLFGGRLDNRKNFVSNRLKEARGATSSLTANTGQIGSPTYVKDCAELILDLIDDDCSGIYNVVNSGTASRYEYVRRIVELSGSPIDVLPTDASGFRRVADVSENETAISYRLRFDGRMPLRPWDDALVEYMSEQGLVGSLAA